jgi:hypothetical protein
MIITERDKVPRCRCCDVGHWSDEVDTEGFCPEHARTKCLPEREEGYYWVTDKNHLEPIIAYYGETDGIDQIDRSKHVSWGYSWTLGPIAEDEGDSLGEYDAEGTVVIHGSRIKSPLESNKW